MVMNIVSDYEYFILKKLQEEIDRAYDKSSGVRVFRRGLGSTIPLRI
jgi:hypothetical protein